MEYSAGTDSKEILLQPRNGIESNDLRSTQTIWGNGLTLSSVKRIELDEEGTILITNYFQELKRAWIFSSLLPLANVLRLNIILPFSKGF